jgi:hypothetical protein
VLYLVRDLVERPMTRHGSTSWESRPTRDWFTA